MQVFCIHIHIRYAYVLIHYVCSNTYVYGNTLIQWGSKYRTFEYRHHSNSGQKMSGNGMSIIGMTVQYSDAT